MLLRSVTYHFPKTVFAFLLSPTDTTGSCSVSVLVVSGKLDQVPVRVPDIHRGDSPMRASPADRTKIVDMTFTERGNHIIQRIPNKQTQVSRAGHRPVRLEVYLMDVYLWHRAHHSSHAGRIDQSVDAIEDRCLPSHSFKSSIWQTSLTAACTDQAETASIVGYAAMNPALFARHFSRQTISASPIKDQYRSGMNLVPVNATFTRKHTYTGLNRCCFLKTGRLPDDLPQAMGKNKPGGSDEQQSKRTCE